MEFVVGTQVLEKGRAAFERQVYVEGFTAVKRLCERTDDLGSAR